MTAPACAHHRHVSSPEIVCRNITLNPQHNNTAVYFKISVATSQTSNSPNDLHTTIAFMTEQSKRGYHIISDLNSQNAEDGKGTIEKFYAEHRGLTLTTKTHTIISRDIDIPSKLQGTLWTYAPRDSPGTLDIGVWYPESDFTIGKEKKTGPAVVILWDFNLPLIVPPKTESIKSILVFRIS